MLCVCFWSISKVKFWSVTHFLKLDFSLKNWYKDIGANINSTLSKLSAAKLLEELGISKYTQDPQCQRSGPVYSPHVNGWKSGTPSFTPSWLFLVFSHYIYCITVTIFFFIDECINRNKLKIKSIAFWFLICMFK